MLHCKKFPGDDPLPDGLEHVDFVVLNELKHIMVGSHSACGVLVGSAPRFGTA